MAYMRGTPYLYVCDDDEGNEYLDIDCEKRLPMESVEELAVMVVAELKAEGRYLEVCERAVRKHGGNTECDELCKAMGEPGFDERLAALMDARKDDA